MASLKRQVVTGGLAVTRDLDTLRQRQQIEIICSNNDIKSGRVFEHRGEGREVSGMKIQVELPQLWLWSMMEVCICVSIQKKWSLRPT